MGYTTENQTIPFCSLMPGLSASERNVSFTTTAVLLAGTMKTSMIRWFILMGLLMPVLPQADDTAGKACNIFYEKLSPIPHITLITNTDGLRSRSDGKSFDGCEVVFKSSEQLIKDGAAGLPSFRAPKDSELFTDGWKEDYRYAADGPGSGTYGIVKGNIVCIVSWDQHAWIDDRTGTIEQRGSINMAVQCMEIASSREQ